MRSAQTKIQTRRPGSVPLPEHRLEPFFLALLHVVQVGYFFLLHMGMVMKRFFWMDEEEPSKNGGWGDVPPASNSLQGRVTLTAQPDAESKAA